MLQNTILGGTSEHALQNGRYFVGRLDPDSAEDLVIDIPVPSRFADERQAELVVEGESCFLVNIGINPTKYNGVSMGYQEQVTLTSEDQFQIGEYTGLLFLSSSGSKDAFKEGGNERLIQLESGIHNDLLDMMDLRRSATSVDLEDSMTRQRIGDCLSGLVEVGITSLDEETSEFLIRQSLYRRLNSAIATSGDGVLNSRRRHAEFENSFFENALFDLCGRVFLQAGVTLEKKNMRADCDKLDGGFPQIYGSLQYELTEGLRQYLKSSHIKTNILDLIFGFGPLEDFLEAPSISEIMVVCKTHIFVEKFGIIEFTRREFYNDRALMAVLEKIVAPVSRRLDQSNPYVDARLPDGSRVNAIIPPLAVKGPCVTIRKFPEDSMTMEELLEKHGALDSQMYNFFKACVENHLNIVVSGGTGSGKTTMLNCLSSFIGDSERIITVEDTAELQLKQEHVVTLESRSANMEGTGEVSIRDLVRNALRMRPDRVVVGECRGKETLDMLQAMNTGHDGSMTTAHANSPVDMMKRLETMVLTGIEMPVSAIRAQIVAAVDIVIQLNRLSSGARKVTSVAEVTGIDELTGNITVENIFEFRDTSLSDGYHAYTGYLPSFLEPMIARGALDPDELFGGNSPAAETTEPNNDLSA